MWEPQSRIGKKSVEKKNTSQVRKRKPGTQGGKEQTGRGKGRKEKWVNTQTGSLK